MLKLEFTAETPEALRQAVTEYLAPTAAFVGTAEIITGGGTLPPADNTLKTAQAIVAATVLTPNGGGGAGVDASGAPVVTPTLPAVVTLAVDAAGTPWDARIHTSNKGQKANGEWKRKPGLDNKVYDKIFAEVTAAPATESPVTPAVIAPVTTATDAPLTGGPDMNDVQGKSAALIMAIAPPVGPLVLNKILTQFGAVAPNTVAGQPPFPTVAALTLDKFPAFIQTIDAVIGNAAGITAENYESMVEILIVRPAA